MRGCSWIAFSVAWTAVTGVGAILVHSVAARPPIGLQLEAAAPPGPTDDQARQMDPNAGLRTTPLERLAPIELRTLEGEEGVDQAEPEQAGEQAWLFSGEFVDPGAAEALARALLAKGAPNDRIAVLRVGDGSAGFVWRVEVGPVTAAQAKALQDLLRRQGLTFTRE